jgi:hypothetical protein
MLPDFDPADHRVKVHESTLVEKACSGGGAEQKQRAWRQNISTSVYADGDRERPASEYRFLSGPLTAASNLCLECSATAFRRQRSLERAWTECLGTGLVKVSCARRCVVIEAETGPIDMIASRTEDQGA